MNLVMQFRKVCNHPDIFERKETTSPLQFHENLINTHMIVDLNSIPQSMMNYNNIPFIPYLNKNPIYYQIPKFIYRNGKVLYSIIFTLIRY
jgi:DNA helicase INO80